MNNSKLVDLEVVKVLTTLLVIIGHVFTNYAPGGLVQPYYGNEYFALGVSYIYSFHMPLFMAVSGAVYYHVRVELGKYNCFRMYITNKAKRLLLPYCFFSLFIVFPTLYVLEAVEGNSIKFFLVNYVLALNPRHLWFVLCLFWIFLVIRLLDTYIQKYKCMSLIICYGLSFVSNYIPSLLLLGPVCRYLVYFYIGYLFMAHKEDVGKYIKVRYMGLAFLVNVFFVNQAADSVIGVFLLKEIAALAGMFAFYVLSVQVAATSFSNTEYFISLSKNSYGIYLFHPCIIYLTLYVSKDYAVNSYLLAFITFVVSLLFSYYGTILFRKVGLKWALGE